MNTLELFAGTRSFSKVAMKLGHATFTLDNDPEHETDVTADVLRWTPPSTLRPDIIWASPPCQGFSVAAIGHSWTGGKGAYIPKSDTAKLGIRLVKRTIALIEELKPRWWFIENPRGVLRNLDFMDLERLSKVMGCQVYRHTVWYCRYGDKRAKPTDLWTNVPPSTWTPRPPCHNGNPDHEAAPRGAKTGTQGIEGAKDRGRIPPALFEEIFNALN